MRGSLKPIVLILLAAAVVVGFSFLTRPRELVKWRTDFFAASAEARQTGKPMLVDFTADWCGACDQMRRSTWSDRAVANALGNYVPVQVNVDAHEELGGKYRVQYLPTLAVIDSEGKVLKQIEGAIPPEDFLAWLSGKQTADTQHATSSDR